MIYSCFQVYLTDSYLKIYIKYISLQTHIFTVTKYLKILTICWKSKPIYYIYLPLHFLNEKMITFRYVLFFNYHSFTYFFLKKTPNFSNTFTIIWTNSFSRITCITHKKCDYVLLVSPQNTWNFLWQMFFLWRKRRNWSVIWTCSHIKFRSNFFFHAKERACMFWLKVHITMKE
jgi:hypothetical protein